MPDERKFGKREGLQERLAEWAEKLSKDKTYPWMGSGLYDDLIAAADALRSADTSVALEALAIRAHVHVPSKKVEYDL